MPIVIHPAVQTRGRRQSLEAEPIRAPLGVGLRPGACRIDIATRLACPPDVLELAEAAVDRACRAIFTPDPLLGPMYSHLASVSSSTVKRHGSVIEAAIASTLEGSGRYEVLRNIAMPIFEATQDILLQTPRHELASRSVALHGAVTQTVLLDLVVIDLSTRQAFACEIKRGNYKSEARKIAQVEFYLRAAELQGTAFLDSLGYRVRGTRAVLLDIYGNAGYSVDLTIAGRAIDDLFGVPIMAVIDTVTDTMRERLGRVMPHLLRAALPGDDGIALEQPAIVP